MGSLDRTGNILVEVGHLSIITKNYNSIMVVCFVILIIQKKKIKDHNHHYHHSTNGTSKEQYADKENNLLGKNHREASLSVSEDTNSRKHVMNSQKVKLI